MNESRQLIKKVPEIREIERSVEPSSLQFGTNYGADTNSEAGTHLRDYWLAVRKHLGLIIGIVLLALTCAAIYMARLPDIFETQARIQVDLENSGAGATKGGAVVFSNTVNDPTYFNTQLQILTGPGLLRRVVKTLDLERDPDFLRPRTAQVNSTWQNLLRIVGLGNKSSDDAKGRTVEVLPLVSEVAPATSREDLVQAKRLAPYVWALQSGLRVEPVKESRSLNRETRLIDIRFNHPDPQIAAKVVNAIADTFVLSNAERKSEANVSTGDFLQKRIAELQSQIRSGEERLLSYAKSKEILSLDPSQNTVVDRLSGLNRQLLEAENERKMAEAAYRAALAPGAVDAMSEDTARLTSAETELARLRQRRAQLLVDNTEEWPEVKEINKQIEAIENQTVQSRSRASSVILTNLETRYRQTTAREQSLRVAFNQQRRETLAQNEAAVNYHIIQQEVETNKSLLSGLLQGSKENEVVRAGTPNNVYVVDYAIAPEFPIGPNRLRGVVMAFFLSLGFGVGVAVILERLDNTISSTEDVEKVLRLPLIAAIPSAGGLRRRRLLTSARGLQRNHEANSPELLLNKDTRSPLAESYRQLRTSVLLSTAGHAPKTLLVTSSVPSEGKTTTATNMAISLGQTGANVLLIDADMRRPRLHSIFGIENRLGLSAILSSEMSEAEVLAMIEKHGESGIYLLPSGPVPPNPAELVGSEQMRRLLTVLESTFTHVVIDSPPISSFTDSVLIGTMVDGVLVVVHSGRSSRQVVRRSCQMLEDVGAKILGVILNNINLRAHDGYYYYQSYYQRSYYGKGGDDNAQGLASSTQE